MKRIYTFFALMVASVAASAQLAVDSNGNIALKGNHNSSYSVTLDASNRQPFYVKSKNFTGGTWANAITSFSEPSGDRFGVGVHGMVYNYAQDGQSGRAFGVLGRAGYATNGYNYGVYGTLLSSHNGAAILGSINTSELGIPLYKRYAGYFDGLVEIKGVLDVKWGIYGTILGASSSRAGANAKHFDLESEAIIERLHGLNASSFYQESSTDIAYRNNMRSESDTLEAEIIPTKMELQSMSKLHYGLSAEQLKETFPDLVYETEDGQEVINYVEMVPILVQAINELSAKVTALEGNNSAARKVATNVDGIGEGVQVLSLGQNRPNPFGTTTDIEVTVPENVQSAFVYVYDLQGKEVQQVDITGRGKQTVQLNAAELTDGMYLYSLIADGLVVETRRMIVRK